MAKLLIPFAEPEGAQRALDVILRETRDPELAVHLVAVVAPSRPGRIGVYMSAERAESLASEAAQRWLASLGVQLAAAGVPFTTEVILGPAKQAIARLAQRNDIDRVVLPPRSRWLSQREGRRIRDLSPHPVTLVA